MNQTRENGHENCANFTSFGSNQDPQSFFRKFYLYQMLNIVASYHCRQFEGKLMIQTREKGEKPHFRPNLGPLGPHLGCQKFFQETGFVIHQISWSAIIMHNIKKTNDQILRKVSDGRTDGRTDRRDIRMRVISQDAVQLTSTVQDRIAISRILKLRKVQNTI